MTISRRTLRSLVRSLLSRSLGEARARSLYDSLSAARELLWNSTRRRLFPAFWRQWLEDRRRGLRTFAIHGEFGDAVLALPFLHREQQRRSGSRVAVVIKGQRSGVVSRSASDRFSESGVRLMKDESGRSVNFLAEFWSRVPFLAEVREGDVKDVRFPYWQAQPSFGLYGRTVGPSDYRSFLHRMFSDDDRRQAEAIWGASGRPIRLAVHLRRSAAEIAALVAELDRSSLGPVTAVALMGSRAHESIPSLEFQRVAVLDLTDNYEKGISLMPLLQTLRSADLFLGGRGGFEIFALASGVPVVTVFDDDGWWEERRLWPRRLWRENPLGCPLRAGRFDPASVFAETIAPWLDRRIEPREEEAVLAAVR
jgi:hypothetical protein